MGVSPSNAAIKAGNKCFSAGQKQINGTKQYKCIKSGNKLIWNKGTAIVKPIPSPQPTVTAEPKFQQLYKSVKSQFKQGSLDPVILEAIYSPNVDKANANILLNQFRDAVSFYSNRFGNNKKVLIVFMNENEREWYDQQVIKYEDSNLKDDWWGSSHCAFTAYTQCGRGSNASSLNILYEVIGSSWKSSNNSRISPEHESVHLYQKSIIGNGMYTLLPPWFGEGQANFLGFVTSSRFIDVTFLRSQSIRSIKNAFPEMNNYLDADWVSAINKCENSIDFCVSNGLGYSLGMLFNEYLYTYFDSTQIDKVLSTVAAGTSWENAIISNLGLNREQLNVAAAKYIHAEVQGDRKS